MFGGTFHPSSYPQVPKETQEGSHRPGSSDFICNCFLCNKLQSYESYRHLDYCPTRSASRRRDFSDTILVQIIWGTLCTMRITICGLILKALLRIFLELKSICGGCAEAYLAKCFESRSPAFPQQISSTTKTCFALQGTEKGFSALRKPQYRRCKYEDGQSLSLIVDLSPLTFKSFQFLLYLKQTNKQFQCCCESL